MKAVKLIVHGLVQGVFYRQSTPEKARSLNLNGTVRNCNDGTVEIFVEGEESAVDELVLWSKKGPAGARVTMVENENIDIGNFIGFKIIR